MDFSQKNSRGHNMFRILFIVIIFTLNLVAQESFVQGMVFEDINKNGIYDEGETGIVDVLVSNQQEVVKTDDKGRYKLPARDEMIVFVTKPSGYNLPVNDNSLPHFFYIHQPKGSPEDLVYEGLQPTGALPEMVNFALSKTKSTNKFSTIVVGDPQPRDSTEVGYFRDDIVAEMYGIKAKFYLALGDIAFDNLNIYKQYNQIVGKLGIPAYNVHGNHDMNYYVPDDKYAAETFKRIFGPTDYSFDYGKVHFIVLDNVEYKGWNKTDNKRGSYRGYINEQQLSWLRNDLAQIPDDRLIVIITHIPIVSTLSDGEHINVVNREELFELLKGRKHILALSAHMHYIEHLQFDKSMGWKSPNQLYSINAGAGCGAWWSGPKDARGIPESFCLDGTPNGHYIFHFDGNDFNYEYMSSKFSKNNQMRISFPFGLVNKDSLDGKNIIVNIFNADTKTIVTCEVDNRKPLRMKQQRMQDPFVIHYISQREYFPGWINNAVENTHIWTLPIPQNLTVGTHTIKIHAVDSKGNKYEGFSIFNVE